MRQSLQGTWTLRADPESAGVDQRWFETFPDDDLIEQQLPAAWQHVIDDVGPDVVWYRREVSLDRPLESGERLWLRFESAATDTRVWVNSVEVGSYTGNWVPFQFDISNAAGESRKLNIVVRVDRIRPGPVREVHGHPQQGGHITKGFHDVLSMQVAGLWDAVSLLRTRRAAFLPDGLWVKQNSETGDIAIAAELEPGHVGGTLHVTAHDPDAHQVAQGECHFAKDAPGIRLALNIANPRLWSPDRPALYEVRAKLLDDGQLSQEVSERFGFRRLTISDDGQRILLNGRPIFISGILDWGHEPQHIQPAPPVPELRERFGKLKQMGFNCECICMWYPPRAFYDLADEMGILIWQEHPVWKSDMSDQRVDEYRLQMQRFFRRDRNRPSVAIVSGSCEHEEFNPKLAEWWWSEAQRQLDGRLIQIQTAFLAWTDLSKTDLYDEHTYDGSGRWACYLRDLDTALARREPKPMVMGESIMFVSWVDTKTYDGLDAWWLPPALASIEEQNQRMIDIDGPDAPAELVEISDRYNLAGRKFQTELVRMWPRNAGLVANGIRDVRTCTCGFQTDQGRWRFDPDMVRSFMDQTVLLLRTPDHRRAFTAGSFEAELGVSNYSLTPVTGDIRITIRGGTPSSHDLPINASLGEVAFAPFALGLPEVDRPTAIHVEASISAADRDISNRWTLWSLPTPTADLSAVSVLADAPFTDRETAFDFEEKKYSSGWGLPVQSWQPRQPDPTDLLPKASQWNGQGAPDARVLVTQRLTDAALQWLFGGGRVLHLPSKAAGAIPATTITGFGQVPWIRPAGPLARFGRDWIESLLDYDLMRLWTRAVCVSRLAIQDQLEPFIRTLYTHDMTERVRSYDILSAARVGQGVLVICSADLHDDAGRTLLDEILHWISSDACKPAREMSIETLGRLRNSEPRT